jgi:amidase
MGTSPGDPYLASQPQRPFLEEVNTSPGKLRIGFSTAHTLGLPVDAACQKAVEHAVEILRSEGHTAEKVELPYQKEDLTKAFLVVVAGEMAGELQVLSDFLGRKVRPGDVEPNTYALHLLGKSFTAADFTYAKRKWNDICRRITGFHEKFDLLLTPTLAQRPFKIGALQNTASENRLLHIINTLGLGSAVRTQAGPLAEKIYNWMPWTAFANMTGQPSMSVPLYWTQPAFAEATAGFPAYAKATAGKEENLPVGVMFTARLGEEDMLFRLAGQLEKAAPWWDKVPPP